MTTKKHFWSYLAQFFLESEMFQTKFVHKIKSHILRSIAFFSKCLCDKAGKNFTAGHATDDSTAHAHCMLDT
jgi:hypothetical protein